MRNRIDPAIRMLLLAACTAAVSLAPGNAHAMDRVRTETKLDQAVAKYGVTGRGVIIAILDRGIDWANPDFITPQGTTRIKGMLDMSGQTGCSAQNPQPVEYTEAQINAALAGGPSIPERDAVGHGTVTAGIAAGNGRAGSNGKYAGVAPEADLLIVKVASEGAPAHDDQLAESPLNACITQALDWVDQQALQLGEPLVGLINSGNMAGPIDGTSVVSQKIDQVFGLNQPGRAYIEASGDEGNQQNHAGVDFGASPATVRFKRGSTQATIIDVWYSGTAGQITVALNDGSTTDYVAPNNTARTTNVDVTHWLPNKQPYPLTSSSDSYAARIVLRGSATAGSVSIAPVDGASTGHVDLYGPPSATAIQFSENLVPGRISDYAATQSAIVTGAYVNRPRSREDPAPGALWPGSSAGPTRDGRLGVDIAAPGEGVYGTSGANSYWGKTFPKAPDDSQYLSEGATSGASPIVMGAVALMLQLDPALTAGQIKDILHRTAVADGNTGTVPNYAWGYGKLDVLAALDAVQALLSGH